MVSITADTILVPMASEDDAESTCESLRTQLEQPATVVGVNVVKKAGGAPDIASVEQREEHADRIFWVAGQKLAADDIEFEGKVAYGTDVAETIVAVADEVDADLIAFSPREASRLARLLTGDVALDLITGTDRPVLVLPTSPPAEE